MSALNTIITCQPSACCTSVSQQICKRSIAATMRILPFGVAEHQIGTRYRNRKRKDIHLVALSFGRKTTHLPHPDRKSHHRYSRAQTERILCLIRLLEYMYFSSLRCSRCSKWCQDCLKRPQEDPKRPQEGSWTSPRGRKKAAGDLQERPQTALLWSQAASNIHERSKRVPREQQHSPWRAARAARSGPTWPP